MKFVNYTRYIPHQDKIAALRPAHREYAKDLMAREKLAAAGPFTDGSGALFIYEAETLQEAELLAAEDPFSKGGAFASCTVARWQILGANHRLLVPDNQAWTLAARSMAGRRTTD
jgi:uncharacterized protein YciI